MKTFDKAPQAYRDSDPWTSKAADMEVRVTSDNQRGKLLRAYYREYLDRNLGMTDEEAAVKAGVFLSCYWKRCGELRHGEYIAPVLDDNGVIEARVGTAGVRRMVCRITPKGLAMVREMER